MKKLLALVLLIIGCSSPKQEKKENIIVLPENPEHVCIEAINDIEKQPNLLKEKLVNNRFGLQLHAKTTPVLFVEEPVFEDTDNNVGLMYREMVSKDKNQWGNIEKLIPTFEKLPQYGRISLLKSGYLYTDNISVAYALGQLVNPKMLFNTKEIYVSRGAILMKAEKKKTGFYFIDGPFQGEKVTLNLFDRITAEPPNDSYLIDLTMAQYDYKFNYITLKHITTETVTAVLYYNGFSSKVLFNRKLAKLELTCISENSTELNAAIDEDTSSLQNLRSAILDQIIERLPFDEPKHEYGNQLDGQLRGVWETVFYTGKNSFNFNGDRYFVFDHLGRPIPPQVCVDFVIDSFNRAAGTWYSKKGERRQRIVGSFDSLTINHTLRNVSSIRVFAIENPEWFNVIHVKDNISIGNKSFYSYLKTLNLQVGDIVFIRGKTPWDQLEIHSHSFFIFEVDPITRFPTLLAGNAGPASLRPWEIETRRTPDRSITMILRPKQKFLDLLNQHKNPTKFLVVK